MTFLYLRRSFRHRPLRHLSLAWVMLCAFLLPLVASVYRDSMMYGSYLQTIEFSKGQAIHIFGGEREDVELLRGIDGLTEPYYEDGWIYLSFASEDAWEFYSDQDSRSSLNNQIKALLSQNGREAESFTVFFYTQQNVYGIQEGTLLPAKWRQMRILSLVLLLFSGLIVQSAYRSHIAAFAPELTELAALGATRRRITGMFLLEFAIVFPLAAGGAVGISYAVMRSLYKLYLEQTVGSTTVWRVFCMDPKNTAVLAAFYLAVCLASLGLALSRKERSRSIQKFRRRPASLTRLWVRQTRPPFAQCLILLVPLIAAFVVLFNQNLSAYSDALQSAKSVEISVYSIWLKGFTQEELDFVAGLSGVRNVETMRKDTKVFFYLDAPDGNTMHGYIYRWHDYAPDEPDLEDGQFVSNLPSWLDSAGTFTLRDEFYRKKASLTLAKRITPEGKMPGGITVYVNDALMDVMAETVPIIKLKIAVSSAYAASVEAALRSEFPVNYEITSSQREDLSGAALREGHLWLLSWIFCILMLTAMQIIWARLSSYVRECGAMLNVVSGIGASRQQLSRLIPVWRTAISAAVLPFLIAIPYIYLRAWRNTRVWDLGRFLVSLPLVGIYLLIAALAALTFLLPVKYTLYTIHKNKT